MEGRLTGFIPHRDGEQSITVTVTADFRETYDELKDDAVEITIKKAQKHRSMEANRYAWALIDQIAAKKHLKKSEVYRNAIREIGGVSQDLLMKAEAVVPFRESWGKQGSAIRCRLWTKSWIPDGAASGFTSEAAPTPPDR